MTDTATLTPIARLARIISGPEYPGHDRLNNGERAALKRLHPDAMRPHQVAALSRALIYAEIDPDDWQPPTWHRWAWIAHGMSLAGHDGKGRLGEQLFRAGVAEARVTKLLTARGDAFQQLLPALLRLVASRGVAPNWHELGALVQNEGVNEDRAEEIRLRIAGPFFAELAKAAK